MADKRIRVEFVDAETNKVFADTESAVNELPETFALNTRVNINGQEWEVIKAEPMTRAEYVPRGALTLTLSKIMMMPVKDILYSLPTLYDALPTLHEDNTPSQNIHAMNADLWRWIEFVPASARDIIDKEFLAVANILQNHREGRGFNKMYVRSKPVAPMAGLIRLTELKALFADSKPFDAVVFHKHAGVAKNVFAFRYGAWIVYGEHTGEAVQSLCLEPKREEAALPLDPILQLMRIYDLLLVDWFSANAMPYQEANLFLKRFQKQ